MAKFMEDDLVARVRYLEDELKSIAEAVATAADTVRIARMSALERKVDWSEREG